MHSGGQKLLLRSRGHVKGPYSLSHVQAMVGSGQVSRFSECSYDGSTWTPLSAVLAQPPAIPKHPTRPQSATGTAQPVDANTRPRFSPDSIMPFRLAHLRLTPRMLMIIVFAMSPLFLTHFVDNMAQAAWFLMGYFAVIWGYLFYFMMLPSQQLRNNGFLYAMFTCFIGIPVLFLWQRFPALQALTEGLDQQAGETENLLLAWIVGVGLVEEVCKALPLLIFALSPRVIRSVRDGVWLGALSGLGFALAEGVSYSYLYWNASALIHMEAFREVVADAQDWLGRVRADQLEAHLAELMPELMTVSAFYMNIQIVRWISLSMLHAAWAGIVGYCIAYAYLRSRWDVFILGLGAASVLHGIYNLFSDSMMGVLIGALSVAAFLLLLRHSQWQDHAVGDSSKRSSEKNG